MITEGSVEAQSGSVATRFLENQAHFVKSFDEARKTLARQRRAERGFLPNKAIGATIGAGVLSWCLGYWSVGLACLLLLVADFIYFCVRRRQMLREFEQGTPRIITPGEAAAADDAFAHAGLSVPSMTDWQNAAGQGAAPEWKTDLRYKELVRLGDLRPNDTVLDLGCGDGRLGWRYGVARTAGTYIGLDLSFDLLRELRRHLPGSSGVQAGADCLPFQNGAITFIACTEAFEHFADPAHVMDEFTRCLKRGGRIVIQSPSAMRIRNANPFHLA